MTPPSPCEKCLLLAAQYKAQVDVLSDALGDIEAWLCDADLCGHFTAEEIRSTVREALTRAEAITHAD